MGEINRVETERDGGKGNGEGRGRGRIAGRVKPQKTGISTVLLLDNDFFFTYRKGTHTRRILS